MSFTNGFAAVNSKTGILSGNVNIAYKKHKKKFVISQNIPKFVIQFFFRKTTALNILSVI
ncbi:hypothetical protein JCM15579A_36280 [Marinifilum fragile]